MEVKQGSFLDAGERRPKPLSLMDLKTEENSFALAVLQAR
jgi:hypothetical protein